MRRYLSFYAITVFLFLNCTNNNPVSDVERYGNTFLHIGYEDFKVPDNWVTHKLFNKALQIKLPPQKSVMDEKPRDPKAFILDKSMLQNIFGVGGFFFVMLLVLLIIFQHADITSMKDLLTFSFGERSHVTTYELTLLFTIFVITHMGYMFNARGYKTGGSGWNLKGCDGFLLIATVITLGQIAIVQVPFLNDFFNVQSLPLFDWIVIFILGFLVTGVRELKHLILK